jgi:hypothetical protein
VIRRYANSSEFVSSIMVEISLLGKVLTSGIPSLFLEEGNIDFHNGGHIIAARFSDICC